MPMLNMLYNGRYRYYYAHYYARYRYARYYARPYYTRYYARPRHARHYTLLYILVAIPSILIYYRISSYIVVSSHIRRRARSHYHVITVLAAIKLFPRLLQSYYAALTAPKYLYTLAGYFIG